MTGTQCAACARLLADGAPLCRECVGRLVDLLLSVPGLLYELTLTRAGLGRTAPPAGGGRPAETPLPVRAVRQGGSIAMQGDSTVLQLEVTLVGWGRALAEDLEVCPAVHTAHLVDLVHQRRLAPLTGARQRIEVAGHRPDLAALAETPASVAEQTAVWLAQHREQLRQHEAAPELLDEITRAVRALQRIVWPPDRQYLGLCPALREDGTKCGHERYAEAEESYSRCRRCGDHRPVAELQATARAAAEDRLYTVAELVGITASVGVRISRATLYRWAQQRRIESRGWQHRDAHGTRITDRQLGDDDRPVYRLGDVLAYARREQEGGSAA